MNEDYLKQFRRMPDANFVDKIHSRLERKEQRQAIKRVSAFSALALIIAFGMVMTFSSTVRAEVLQTIEEIAGLRFDVTTDYPGDPDEVVTIVPSEYLSLEEAQNRFPSPVALPAYTPRGTTRREDVLLTYWSSDLPSLTITWDNPETGEFILDIRPCSTVTDNCGLILGEGALEEITLNGEPAVIVRGAWNYDTRLYDTSVTSAIRWKYDENTVYSLSTWSQDMPLEELIRIAESIP
jgi:hypothetical protein